MSLATDTLDRIRNSEQFHSFYTTLPSSDYGIMQVDDDAIFAALTHEEKIHYSDRSGKYPVLTIWTKTWMFVSELNRWILIGQDNMFNDELSQYPDFIRLKDGFLLDVECAALYKAVD